MNILLTIWKAIRGLGLWLRTGLINDPAFRQFAFLATTCLAVYFAVSQCSQKQSAEENLAYQEAVNDTLRWVNKSLISQRDGAFAFADSINRISYAKRDSIKKVVDKLPVTKQSELVRSKLAELYPD